MPAMPPSGRCDARTGDANAMHGVFTFEVICNLEDQKSRC